MKISVCCSSSNYIDEKYYESSRKLIEEIFKENNDLVFGAMNSGIMAIAYEAAKKNGRKVIGITPEQYKEDFESIECDKEIITPNCPGRTEIMVENSDLMLFLPGGIGTIYELIYALETKRNGEMDLPLVLYNETGFFDETLKMLEKEYNENFTNEKVRSMYTVTNDCQEAMEILNKINETNKTQN